MGLPLIPVVVAAGPAWVLEVMEAVGPKCPEVPGDASDTLGPGNCDYSVQQESESGPILPPTSSEPFYMLQCTFTVICYHGFQQ